MQPGTRERRLRRLFVAVWPAPRLAAELTSLAKPYLSRGRPVGQERLHLTLAFLGALSPAQTESVLGALALVHKPACSLVLDRVGHWRRSGILWFGSSNEQPAILDLATSVRASLTGCGLTIERRLFHPHVTIARKCWQPPALGSIKPVVWPIDNFSLIESTLHQSGSRYRPLETWALQKVD